MIFRFGVLYLPHTSLVNAKIPPLTDYLPTYFFNYPYGILAYVLL